MGVHDLWKVLARSERKTSLDQLSGHVLAVDLSGWVCQATTYMNPLRNLYFRIHHLYCHGVSLVFVVDGEVPAVKEVMMRSRGYDTTRASFKLKAKKCCDLLHILGVPFLHSKFEAEAYCALLDSAGVVKGTVSDDGDTFLYGGRTVYRNLSLDEKNPQISCYKMEVIQEKIGLSRNDLVALALLLGCDYCPKGVPGVGRKIALQLLRAWKRHGQSYTLLDRFRRWASTEFGEDEMISPIEKYVHSKAMEVPGFPNEEVIEEFLVPKDDVSSDIVAKLQWRMPNLVTLQEFCTEHLKWNQQYTLRKAANLLTQWVLRQPSLIRLQVVHSVRIVKERIRHGVSYYEIEWTVDATIYQGLKLTTLERIEKFKTAFPELCAEFNKDHGATTDGNVSVGEDCGSQEVMDASSKNCSSEDSDEEEKAFASMRKRRKIGRL